MISMTVTSTAQHQSYNQLLLYFQKKNSTVFYQVQCALFYMENDTEIFPAHYTWKVAEIAFKMASMMNKLAMMNSCEISIEK